MNFVWNKTDLFVLILIFDTKIFKFNIKTHKKIYCNLLDRATFNPILTWHSSESDIQLEIQIINKT